MSSGAVSVGGAFVRETLVVGLIAGQGVDLSGLAGILGGGGPPGFSLLSRENVVGAEVEGNEMALKLKTKWEEDKTTTENAELPMPSDLFGCLLDAVLRKAQEAPAELPDNDDASTVLLKIPGGPKSVRVTLEVPQSLEEAQGFLSGGGLDAILVVRKEPPAEDGSSEHSTDAGIKAERLYSDLQNLGGQERLDGHNPMSDTFFGVVFDAATPEQTLQNVAKALIDPVYHRQEYAKWLQGISVVQMPSREVDLRHYDHMLSNVPHSCLSVPIILNALLEQVAVNEADPAAENRTLRQTWVDNKRLMDPFEEAFASLSGTPSPPAPSGEELGKGAMLSKLDERTVRLTDPSSLEHSASRQAIAGARLTELNLALTLDLARLFPVQGAGGAKSVADSVVLHALPKQKLTPAQARHGLLLLELEQLLGVESGKDKQVRPNGPRSMQDMSMHKMSVREELSAEALQQQLAAAILHDEPEVITRYYPREDALVVALCTLVPKGRVSRSVWKSPLCAHLGFSQWLAARTQASTALGEAEEDGTPDDAVEPEQVAESAPQEVTAGAEGGGEEDAAAAAETEAPPPPRKEYVFPSLPLPEKPERLFDLNAQRAIMLDEQQTMVMSEGTKLVAGVTQAGGYVRWHTPSHAVLMREQASSSAAQPAAGWGVSVTYEDGACLLLRQIANEGGGARVCASMSTADGVHVTLDGGKDGDGIVWRSVPHARAGGSRVPLAWKPAAGVSQSASLSATPASEGAGAEGDTEGADGEAKPKEKKVKALPQGAPVDANPKEADATMVLPLVGAGGAQVIRKADGTARVLLPDGSVGWYGGEGRGWEWTNHKGMRQGKVPEFPGQPQFRDGVAVGVERNNNDGSMTMWREDGVYRVEVASSNGWADGWTRLASGGVKEVSVRFPDGSLSSSQPAQGITNVVREGLGEVWLGPHQCERRVRLEDGTVMSLSADGVLRVTRLGDCAEVVCEIESGLVRFYSLGRPDHDDGVAATGGEEEDELLSQQVRSAGPGCFFMDLSKGTLRVMDTSNHLYKVVNGAAKVVLAGEPVPLPSDAPPGPSDGSEEADSSAPVSTEGAERLEPLRVFVMRRNGTGYELLASEAAERVMKGARRAGNMVLEETHGEDVLWTMVAVEERGKVQEAEAATKLTTRLQYTSQRPTGGRGGGGVRWRQLVRGKPLDEQLMAELREAVQTSFDKVMEEGVTHEAQDSEFVTMVKQAVAEEMEARGGQEAALAWVKGKLEMLGNHKPLAAPEIPTVTRPPIQPKPSKFTGVKAPEEPAVLRPRYFDSEEGSKFLDSIPDGRKKITKEKRPWKVNMRGEESNKDAQQDDSKGDEEYEEPEELGSLPSMQQYQQGQQDIYGDRSQGPSTRGGSSFHRPIESARSGVSLPRQPTTNYHLRHLRPAHYDVLNRPRKNPELDRTRFDAEPHVNDRNLRLELPVSRRVHTSSVLLRTMLDHARGTDELSLGDSVLEGGPHRLFRLRPRRAALGQLMEGQLYRFKMVLSNVGDQAARFRVKQPQDGNGNISVVYTPGAVAAGMSVVLEVEILAEECGVIDTYASIETETEVFEVPISAAVLSEAQFQEWQDEGGNLPCNVTSVDQTPKKQVRSRAPAVATLKKQLAEKRTQGEGRAVSPSGMGRDLQDPVPEPEVPSTEIDWFVDWGKNLSDIKEMTPRARLRERMIQDLVRRNRDVNEASLAGIDAFLKQKFNPKHSGSPRTRSPTGTATSKHSVEGQGQGAG